MTSLQFFQTYYWRVDSVNGFAPSGVTGNIWSFTVVPGFKGTGLDGNLTVATSFNINTQTAGNGGRIEPDGVIWIIDSNVSSGQDIISSGNIRPAGFAVNDQIIIINLKGTTGDYADVGKYEFKYITELTDNYTIKVDANLATVYNGTTQKIVVQRVPNYNNVSVPWDTTLTCNAWDGNSGGVLAFKASGTVSVGSTGTATGNRSAYITASAKGHKGGTGDYWNVNSQAGETYFGGLYPSGGIGYDDVPQNGLTTPNPGGGGGGAGSDMWNYTPATGSAGTAGPAGGGGGSAWTAWASGGYRAYGGGGGGAGYGTVGSGGYSPYVVINEPPYSGPNYGIGQSGLGTIGGKGGDEPTQSWDCSGGGGGGGGTFGDSTTLNSQVFLGAGGGAGGGAGPDTNPKGGNGGAGGGIVIIAAGNVNIYYNNNDAINEYGYISAGGENGYLGDPDGLTSSGCGGGGSGGSLVIMANNLSNLHTNGLTVNGGLGGTGSVNNPVGGNGGFGRRFIQYDNLNGVNPGFYYAGSPVVTPAKVTGPNPANGATNVPVTQALTWSAAISATSYDVYFGTAYPPPYVANTTLTYYAPALMEYSTTYYWRIDSVNGVYGYAVGDNWSFTTGEEPGSAPDPVANPPIPADGGAIDLNYTVLQWLPSISATVYDVYMSTTTPPTTLIVTTDESAYYVANLPISQTIYWQVNARNGFGTASGNIWSFIVAPTFKGTGLDGDLTVWTSFNINTQTNGNAGRTAPDGVIWAITNNVNSGQRNITSGVAIPAGLAVNDNIIIMNIKGTTVDYDNAGKYEFKYITGLVGNTITVDSDLSNTYNGTTQKTVVMRVPNYRNVSVQWGGTLTCKTWDGTSGGIVAFRALGTVSIGSSDIVASSRTASINASSKGFLGGTSAIYTGVDTANALAGEAYYGGLYRSGGATLGGMDDWSTGGVTTPNPGGGGGGGAIWYWGLNGTHPGSAGTTGSAGGGGGGATGTVTPALGGGGGGAGHGIIGGAGLGAPDADIQAAPGSGTSGGTGGGNSPSVAGSAGGGGGGGTSGNSDVLNAISYLGAGGGAGGCAYNRGSNNLYGASGGAGGGFIYIAATAIINYVNTVGVNNDYGYIIANGGNAPAVTPVGSIIPGGGGGGAGGSIVLIANTINNMNASGITTNGGSGSAYTGGYAGGNGGGGRAYIRANSDLSNRPVPSSTYYYGGPP